MSYGGKIMDYFECDDMMEGTWGYCAADHCDCMNNRRRCKKADDTIIKRMGSITINDL